MSDSQRVWLRWTFRPEPSAFELAAALDARGIATSAWSGDARGGICVVPFVDVDGGLLELVHALAETSDHVICVGLVAGASSASRLELTWKLLDAGAADIVTAHDVDDVAQQIAGRLLRFREIDAALDDPWVREHCLGTSTSWQQVLRRAADASRHGRAPVLVTGETGTGKEVIARLLHHLARGSATSQHVTVDCTTIVRELSGSELFGHVRGAFTGAHSDRSGAFAAAHGGTLFLDEIGELPLTLQAELLRVVQERTYKAVGSNVWNHTDFRLVAATHRDLAKDVASGRFREDLYYRLVGFKIELPPLRARSEDIVSLAEHFARATPSDSATPELSVELKEFVAQHPFPGNVRQLRSLIERAVLRWSGPGPVTLGMVAPEDRQGSANGASAWLRDLDGVAQRALSRGVSMKDLGRMVDDAAIRCAMRSEDGSLQRAAKRLGVTDRALQLRMASERARLADVVDVSGRAS
jgi:DNA-binding NtrC family response regulator